MFQSGEARSNRDYFYYATHVDWDEDDEDESYSDDSERFYNQYYAADQLCIRCFLYVMRTKSLRHLT